MQDTARLERLETRRRLREQNTTAFCFPVPTSFRTFSPAVRSALLNADLMVRSNSSIARASVPMLFPMTETMALGMNDVGRGLKTSATTRIGLGEPVTDFTKTKEGICALNAERRKSDPKRHAVA